MTYQDLRRLNFVAYRNLLEDYLCDVLDRPADKNGFWFLNQSEGHQDMHFDQEESELFQRLFREDCPAASCFYNATEARDYIANAMIYCSEQIAQWFLADRMSFSDRNQYYRLFLTLDMRQDCIGYGLNRDLQLIDSRALTVVLDRDYESDSAIGISIVTAYPDLIRKPQCLTVIQQGKIEEMVHLPGYCKSNEERLYCIAKVKYPKLDVRYVERDYVPTCCLFHQINGRKFEVYFQGSTITLRERFPAGVRATHYKDIALADAKFGRVIASLNNEFRRMLPNDRGDRTANTKDTKEHDGK